MKILKKTGCGLLIALLPLLGHGQSTDTLRLNLEQALEIAMNDNPTIRIAEQEIQRVDYSKKEAWYALIPNLEASAQASKFVVAGKTAMMGMIMDSPADFSLSANLNLSLPLVAPGLWDMIKMTTLDMQLAREKANASKITLRNEVTKAYYTILLAQDAYSALSEGFDIAKENYEQAKNRYNVGMAAEYDMVSAEVQMVNLTPNLLQAENGIAQAKMYLKILMGVDLNRPLTIAGALVDYENEVYALNNYNGLSIENNTDLKQLEIQQQQLEKTLSLQRSARIPTLAAFGQFGYSGSKTKDFEINMGTPIPVPGSEDWYHTGVVVGLQLNVPLTGLFTNTAKEKQIKVQSKALALQRDYIESNLNAQVQIVVDNMVKASKQVESAKKGIELSEKGHTITRKRYETGGGTMLELQAAAAALTQSKLSYGQAIADYLSAKADYEKMIGK